MKEKHPTELPTQDSTSALERAKPRSIEPVHTGFRFRDFLVIVFCVSGIFYFLNLFRLDLFQTINLQNAQPVGFVKLKSNVVQRRISSRVLWDRLLNESPVYLWDLIRVAELSSAALEIKGQQINLNENTLVRIQLAADGETLQIELTEGSMSISTGNNNNNLRLNLMGQMVETAANSTLNVSAGNKGITVHVNEGAASLIGEGGRSRTVSSGSMVALDTSGAEQRMPSAVVTQPRANARFLKNTKAPLPVTFSWNRVNLGQNDLLRLEISEDRNFNRITHAADGLIDTSSSSFDAGLWHWRLLFAGGVLSTGRFNVIQAAAPELISPIKGSSVRYNSDLPSVLFRWSQVEEASQYFLEVSLLPDFGAVQVSAETAATSYIQQGLGQGVWYWRVTPVFSSGYEGQASSSAASQFRVEKSEQTISGKEDVVLPPPPAPPPPPPVPLELRLLSPATRDRIAGLTALRTPTVFRWSSDKSAASSRFVLSQNTDPLRSPAVVINNPGQTLQVNKIDAGVWYWTVEARSVEGLVSSAPPQQLLVLPIPLLPAPGNLQPAAGHRLDLDTIKNSKAINLFWQAVPGANAYIFTLSEQTPEGRRQIIRSSPQNRTSWTLADHSILSRSTFIWQVEAVNTGQNGVIDQRGTIGESSFILDFPLPEVHANTPGILYGQ